MRSIKFPTKFSTNWIVAAGLALVAIALQPSALSQQVIGALGYSGVPARYFCGPGVTNATVTTGGGVSISNIAWFASSCRGDGVPRLLSVSFVSDIIANALTVYTSTNSSTITNAGVSGTNQLWLDTTGFASNDVIVIRYFNADTYQRCQITNVTASQMGIVPSTGLATSTSDIIYKMSPISSGVLLCHQAGSTTVTNVQSAAGLLSGRMAAPLLFDVGYSNAGSIKNVFGDYAK